MTAKICTNCLREYDQYSQHLQTMMISKREHRREQDEEQSAATSSYTPILQPEDYRRYVNESSHIMSEYGNTSMVPELHDYMASKF